MSNRPGWKREEKLYVMAHVKCSADSGHDLGDIGTQQGRLLIGSGLERIDRPDGGFKIQAVCMKPGCRLYGKPQQRRDHHFLEALEKGAAAERHDIGLSM
jgi:hypothetical protein